MSASKRNYQTHGQGQAAASTSNYASGNTSAHNSNNKRKRIAARSGGDDNVGAQTHSLGGTAFEVPLLPNDFDGIPIDGGQYLALVQRQAAQFAPVYRVAHNPYAIAYDPPTDSHKSGIGKGKGKAPAGDEDARLDEELLYAAVLPRLPSAAWRVSFQRKFRNARYAMALPRAGSIDRSGLPPQEDLNEGVWFQWIFGYGMRARRNQLNKKHNSGSGAAVVLGMEEDQKREPSTATLSAIPQEAVLRLLEWIPEWIIHPAAQQTSNKADYGPLQLPQAMPPHVSKWTFALLCALSSHLDSDETSVLRVLARACLQSIVRSRWRYRLKAKKRAALFEAEGREGAANERDRVRDGEEEGDDSLEKHVRAAILSQQRGAKHGVAGADEEDAQFDEYQDDDDDIAYIGTPSRSAVSSTTAHSSTSQQQRHQESRAEARAEARAKAQQQEVQQLQQQKEEEKRDAAVQVALMAQRWKWAEEARRAERGAWIVIAAVAEGWAQKDLWDEARSEMEKVPLL